MPSAVCSSDSVYAWPGWAAKKFRISTARAAARAGRTMRATLRPGGHLVADTSRGHTRHHEIRDSETLFDISKHTGPDADPGSRPMKLDVLYEVDVPRPW